MFALQALDGTKIQTVARAWLFSSSTTLFTAAASVAGRVLTLSASIASYFPKTQSFCLETWE